MEKIKVDGFPSEGGGNVMPTSIKIPDDLAEEIGQFGNRDETWETTIRRLINHVDRDAAMEDRRNRQTTADRNPTEESGNELVKELEDGTVVVHKYERGKYAGEEVHATVDGGHIRYDGELWSPSGAAREADQDVRGEDARPSESYGGPGWWYVENENGKREKLREVGQ